MNWPARPLNHTPDKTGRPDEPWWTREAITWMDAYLKPYMNVLEWGSGASTCWMASRVQYVTTMEHDDDWYERVIGALFELKLADRWQAICRHLSPIYCENAVDYAIRHGNIDAAIVDGRLRVFCCERASEALNPGGILLLDNAERQEYAEVHELLADWPVVRTDNGLWRTDIWTKPQC